MTPRRALLWLPLIAIVSGCATLTGRDPVQVHVVGVEPLHGEGMEMRFLCKLRVQNPNDTPIEFDGVYIELEVRGSSLASGVSDAAGSVPRYGEVVLAVPVTVSALGVARQVFSFYTSTDRSRIDYVVTGKIGGPAFTPVRFQSRGELTWPSSAPP
jgi:LEA14-like dessication related protein